MFHKDFALWHKVKSATDTRNTQHVFIREGAVWLMRLGVNIGSELDGKGDEFLRPIIVIKGINDHVFFGIPV
jgi:mRNA interferase MazF